MKGIGKMKKNVLMSIVFGVNLVYAGGSMGIVPVSTPIAVDKIGDVPLVYLSDVYVGAGIGKVTLDVSSTNEELSTKPVTLLAGFDINKYVGVEGRYSKGFQDVDYTGANLSKSLDSRYGNIAVYLKAGYEIQNFKPYVLLGYGETEFTNLEGFDRKEAGFQYGGGVEYKINKHWHIFVDYVREYDGTGFDGRARLEDITVDHATLGFRYQF